jgi:hypothetical protein
VSLSASTTLKPFTIYSSCYVSFYCADLSFELTGTNSSKGNILTVPILFFAKNSLV